MLLPFFCFTSLHQQNVSLWLFSSMVGGVTPGEMGRTGKARHGGHGIFGQKLLNTQDSVGMCSCKSPIMKQTNTMKVSSKKNSLKLNTASHYTTSWCTDTDGFLAHSPSKGSLYSKGPTLQKMILDFLGVPLIFKFQTVSTIL